MKKLVMVFILTILILMPIFSGGWPRTNFWLINISGEVLSYSIKYKENIPSSVNGGALYQNEHRISNENKRHTLKSNFEYNENLYLFTSWNLNKIDLIDFFQLIVEELTIFDNNNRQLATINSIKNIRTMINIDWYNNDYEYDCYFIIEPGILNGTQFSYPYIATENLRVRDSDSINGNIITTIFNGEQLKILSIGKAEELVVNNLRITYFWVKIETINSVIGWCYSYYIKPKNGT